jgi:hypothetical protein
MLPKITDDTVNSTLATLQDDSEFAENTIKDIKENNPVLYSMLELISSSNKDPEYIRGYIVGASQFYSLLDRQKQSDLLNMVWGT